MKQMRKQKLMTMSQRCIIVQSETIDIAPQLTYSNDQSTTPPLHGRNITDSKVTVQQAPQTLNVDSFPPLRCTLSVRSTVPCLITQPETAHVSLPLSARVTTV